MTGTDTFVPPAWLDRDAWPFAPHFSTRKKGRIHYVDEGRGNPVLFVHGTPTWSFEYRHLIRALSPTNRCIASDHFGLGLSDRPADFSYSIQDHACVLRAIVEELDLRDLTLVVHDFGGPIGLPLALETGSRVRRVVLMNTWMWPFDDDPAMVRKARLAGSGFGRFLYRHLNFSQRVLMPSVYGDRTRLTPAIHRQYLEGFRDKDARVQVLHAFARALLEARDHYASLWLSRDRLARLPVLILWGMKDSAFPPAMLERWRTALPDASVVELPGSGHWPHEEEPDAVIRAIREWPAWQAGSSATIRD